MAYNCTEITDEQDFNESVYFDLVTQPKTDEIANYVNVTTMPLALVADVDSIFSSDDTYSIPTNGSIDIEIDWSDKPVKIDTVVLGISVAFGVATISSSEIYAWGAKITVTGNTGSNFIIEATGKKYEALSSVVATSEDEDSIKEYGKIVFDFEENHLIQSVKVAQQVADGLVRNYKGVRNDAEITFPGNLAVGLADPVLLTEYSDSLIDTRNFFYITRQQLEYKGSLDVSATLRRIT